MPKAKAPKGTPKTKKGAAAGKKGAATTEATKLYSSFLPIPVTLPASSSSTAPPATHYIYVRRHRSSPPTEDDDRTVFVANLPVDADTHSLRTLFGRWGVVESVELSRGSGGDVLEAAVKGLPMDEDEDEDEDETDDEDGEHGADADAEAADEDQRAEPTFMGSGPILPRSQRKRRKPNTLPPSVPEVAPLPEVPAGPGVSGMLSGRVVFLDSVSVPRVMAYTGSALQLAVGELSGLAFFEAQYTALRPTLAAVREHADTAMARYDHLHSLLLTSRAKAQGAGALVDEDGFTVVVRGGRYGRTAGRAGDAGGGAGVAIASRKSTADEGKKKSKGSGPLGDFYRFQLMDRKRKELADLRARFDEDRKKVDALKANKRFRPY